MSDWYDEARRRLEQKQQHKVRQQQQVCDELLNIVRAAGAKEKLEFIKEIKWNGYGLIEPYQRKAEPYRVIDNSLPYGGFQIHPGFSGASLQLHFEYEVLKFVVLGGYPVDPPTWSTPHFEPEGKELIRSTEKKELTISAIQNELDGSRQLWFAGKPLSTPFSNFAALVQELDEAIYQYCHTTPSLLEEKAKQDQINQSEEEAYRKYIPRNRP